MARTPKLIELEDWLTTGQVAKRLGRSRQGILNLARDGRFRAVHVGKNHEPDGERGVWIFDPESVEEFAKAHPNHPKGEG
jgi:excisionase family DNA binding protein